MHVPLSTWYNFYSTKPYILPVLVLSLWPLTPHWHCCGAWSKHTDKVPWPGYSTSLNDMRLDLNLACLLDFSTWPERSLHLSSPFDLVKKINKFHNEEKFKDIGKYKKWKCVLPLKPTRTNKNLVNKKLKFPTHSEKLTLHMQSLVIHECNNPRGCTHHALDPFVQTRHANHQAWKKKH